MKLKTQISGQERELLFKVRGSKIEAVFDGGRPREVVLRSLGDAEYLIVEGSRNYHCHIARQSGGNNKFIVSIRGLSYEVQITDPKRLRSSADASGHARGQAQILAPMPGKVVRVLMALGDAVEQGTGILVVEAMKMQNELKSPKAGKVAQLNAQPGDTVNAGDVLAVIE